MELRNDEPDTKLVRRAEFSAFVEAVEPRLRRALSAMWGMEGGREATAEALAWAWENWSKVQEMENSAGYLYRVGVSRIRRRTLIGTRFIEAMHGPDDQTHCDPGAGSFEPALPAALDRLSQRQRAVAVLIHGCEWTHQEVADALGLSRSSVGTHLERAMANLRSDLGVN